MIRKRRVEEPLTEDLLAELLEASDPVVFADRHALEQRSLSEYLTELLDRKGLNRIDVIHEANLNETYGYQIFMGQRKPSRDKLLQIAFAMRLTLRETNRALNAAGAGSLYCKNRRDAIIIFCLSHGYSLLRVNEELYSYGEDTIC